MTVAHDRVRITFELTKDEDGYPPVASERLWAAKLDDGTFQVDSIPFYVRGISSGDNVEAQRDSSGELAFRRLIQSGGNTTFRVFVPDREKLSHVRKEITDLGLDSETHLQAGLIAVEIAGSADIGPFLEYIMRGKQDARFDFEEAAFRHEID